MYFKLLEMQCTFPLIFDSVNNDFYPIRRIVFFQPPFYMCLSVEVLLNTCIRTMGIMEGSTKPSLFVHLKPYIPCYLRSKDIYTKIYIPNTAISSFNALFSNFYGGQNE